MTNHSTGKAFSGPGSHFRDSVAVQGLGFRGLGFKGPDHKGAARLFGDLDRDHNLETTHMLRKHCRSMELSIR